VERALPGGAGRRRSVSASYAAKNFGALVGAVREERVAFVVERSGVPSSKSSPPAAREPRWRIWPPSVEGRTVSRRSTYARLNGAWPS